MKQEKIIKMKLWQAWRDNEPTTFGCDYYQKADILAGLAAFDLNHVRIEIKPVEMPHGNRGIQVSIDNA